MSWKLHKIGLYDRPTKHPLKEEKWNSTTQRLRDVFTETIVNIILILTVLRPAAIPVFLSFSFKLINFILIDVFQTEGNAFFQFIRKSFKQRIQNWLSHKSPEYKRQLSKHLNERERITTREKEPKTHEFHWNSARNSSHRCTLTLPFGRLQKHLRALNNHGRPRKWRQRSKHNWFEHKPFPHLNSRFLNC